jgi:arylsulfatase A-like enzyme
MARRPNIVLILADDLGFSDLGCYGGEIATPNLDRLAAGGMRFTHFYNNAVCVATRASLLTGQYCHKVGLGHLGGRLCAGGNNVTFAELLRDAGYRTLMSGKWHNGHGPGELPVERGFDRYWGLVDGGSNYFNPGVRRPGEPEPVHKAPGDCRFWGDDERLIKPFTPEDPDFYITDSFSEHAVAFLDRYGAEERPFLLYLAYTAPHFPLQAPPEDIARYQGRYLVGWDEVRRRRYRRLLELGIVQPHWGISERDAICGSWEQAADKPRWDRKMAVYAAMVERMDRGIGRVLDKLRELNAEDNTLVLFLSDNGGCGEHIDNTPDRLPGTVDTYTTVDAPWANASNTPFRKYKVFDHEGGIATPLIACWPAVIEPGAISHEVGHVVDFLPTFAELAGAEYPESYRGNRIVPADGISLAPLLRGQPRSPHPHLCWELNGCRAIRRGRWKAVSMGPPRCYAGHRFPPGCDGWELYDMAADRCETNDMAAERPGLVRELDTLWRGWYERCRREQRRAHAQSFDAAE